LKRKATLEEQLAMSIHTSRTILASVALSIVILFLISSALRFLGLSGEIGTTVTAGTGEIGLWETVETNQSPVGWGEGRGAGCGGHLRATLTPLEDAIWLIETGRREGAIMGDGGTSRGPLQISRAAWIDSGLPGDYADVDRLDYAVLVMRAYWDRYATGGTDEQKARVWNGGPRGASNKKATEKYWGKVSAALDK
jgi:hypothetical protein